MTITDADLRLLSRATDGFGAVLAGADLTGPHASRCAGWTQRDILFLALLPVYIPGLAFLYSRMFMARRKSLGDDFAGTKGLQIIRKRQAEYSARISRPLAPSKPKADTEVVEAELAVDEM